MIHKPFAAFIRNVRGAARPGPGLAWAWGRRTAGGLLAGELTLRLPCPRWLPGGLVHRWAHLPARRGDIVSYLVFLLCPVLLRLQAEARRHLLFRIGRTLLTNLKANHVNLSSSNLAATAEGIFRSLDIEGAGSIGRTTLMRCLSDLNFSLTPPQSEALFTARQRSVQYKQPERAWVSWFRQLVYTYRGPAWGWVHHTCR